MIGTAPTGRRERLHWALSPMKVHSFFLPAHIGYFVPLIKIADFLRADVEVLQFHSFLEISSPCLLLR